MSAIRRRLRFAALVALAIPVAAGHVTSLRLRPGSSVAKKGPDPRAVLSADDDTLSSAVSMASRALPGCSCLPQAQTMRTLMALAGRTGDVRFGVARDGATGFAAHAWVEGHDGRVVHGSTQRHYATMAAGETGRHVAPRRVGETETYVEAPAATEAGVSLRAATKNSTLVMSTQTAVPMRPAMTTASTGTTNNRTPATTPSAEITG